MTSYLHVWGVTGEEWVQRPAAVPAGEALLVVDVVQADHLLCGEHLDIVSDIQCDNVWGDIRTVPAHLGQAFSPSLLPIV